jgi:hypothetical protein
MDGKKAMDGPRPKESNSSCLCAYYVCVIFCKRKKKSPWLLPRDDPVCVDLLQRASPPYQPLSRHVRLLCQNLHLFRPPPPSLALSWQRRPWPHHRSKIPWRRPPRQLARHAVTWSIGPVVHRGTPPVPATVGWSCCGWGGGRRGSGVADGRRATKWCPD